MSYVLCPWNFLCLFVCRGSFGVSFRRLSCIAFWILEARTTGSARHFSDAQVLRVSPISIRKIEGQKNIAHVCYVFNVVPGHFLVLGRLSAAALRRILDLEGSGCSRF